MKIKRIFCLLVLALATTLAAQAQKVALKTNLLDDAVLDANLGIEFGLAPSWTLDITGSYNGWTLNGHKWKHLAIQPEARYWFCDRFAGHFLGIHALGGKYNFGNIKSKVKFLGSDFSGLAQNRYQGWGIGAGIAYGYAWMLGRHWNLELEIGAGYIYTRYDKFECKECGERLETDTPHHYVGPTKAALNLVYVF